MNEKEKTAYNKVLGFFIGGAIGDALYMPVETFNSELIRERYGRLTTYIRPDGHKWFDGRPAGTWTDDTQLTLALSESLIHRGKIDMDDMAKAHVESVQKEGDLGFGPTSKQSIKRLAAGIHWSKSGKSQNPNHGFGNGVVMKVGPLGLYRASPAWDELWVEERADFINSAVKLTLMSHYSRMAIDSSLAHIFAVKTCFAEGEFSIENFLKQIIYWSEMVLYGEVKGKTDKLTDRFKVIGELDLAVLTPGKIIELFNGGTTYVFDSLPFSYAFFLKNPHSIESLYDVGNAGGDTDTNASIVGGLLGALNGISIFPQNLIDGLLNKERIFDLVDRFYKAFFAQPKKGEKNENGLLL